MELKDFIKETISQIAESVNELNELMTSKLLLVCILPLLLTSCQAEIEPSAANSASAIIAVIGEYLFAFLFLIVCFIMHLLRISAVVISTIALYSIYSGTNMWNLDPVLLLVIGLVIIVGSFFFPVKLYSPKIVIAENISKYKYKYESKNDNKSNTIKGYVIKFVIEVIIGVLSGYILIKIQ